MGRGCKVIYSWQPWATNSPRQHVLWCGTHGTHSCIKKEVYVCTAGVANAYTTATCISCSHMVRRH